MVCREPLAFKAATLGQNAVAREARSDGHGSLNTHTSHPQKGGNWEIGKWGKSGPRKRSAWDIINLKACLAMAMFAKSVRCLGSQLFIIGRVHLHGADSDRVDLL